MGDAKPTLQKHHLPSHHHRKRITHAW